MGNNYAEYIQKNLDRLQDYINYLVDVKDEYYKELKIFTTEVDKLNKSQSAIQFEKRLLGAYDNAKRLYDDLKLIAQKYNSRMNVKWDLESFHRRLTTTRFPKFDNTKIKLTTTGRCPKNGNLTGFAAKVYENYLTDEERKMFDDYMQGNLTTEEDEKTPILQCGLQYNHNTEDDNKDYYTENIGDDDGYTGDSMELAAEYKRKYEEEQKKIAEELTKQQAAVQTTPQQSSANWIMPCQGKIVGKYLEPRPTHIHNGIDIAVPIGTPIKAIADGKVYYAGANDPKGYGKYIILEHNINGKTITSEYGHLSTWIVSSGQNIKKGQIIGYSGNTGHSDGPHCHLTIREGVYKGQHVNPYKYIKP